MMIQDIIKPSIQLRQFAGLVLSSSPSHNNPLTRLLPDAVTLLHCSLTVTFHLSRRSLRSQTKRYASAIIRTSWPTAGELRQWWSYDDCSYIILIASRKCHSSSYLCSSPKSRRCVYQYASAMLSDVWSWAGHIRNFLPELVSILRFVCCYMIVNLIACRSLPATW
jgi:hypothetical protein